MAGRTSVSPPSPGVHSRRPYFSSQLSARAAREDEDELPEDRTVTDFPASAKPLLCDAPGSPSCRSDYDSACNLRPPTPPPGTFPCPAKGYFSAAAGRLAALFAAFFGLVAVLAAVRHAVPMPKTHDYRDLRFDWTPFDPRYLEPLDKDFGPYNLLVDTHSHTTFSDGRMSPAQLVSWSKVNGFDAIVVSDHNTVEGALATRDWAAEHDPDFIVIPAIEYSSCRIHMNLIGIDQVIEIAPVVPTNDELKEMIDRVHSLGGIVMVNHIPWSNTTNEGYQVARLPNHPSRDELVAMGVDAFEVSNEGVFDPISWAFARSHNASSGRRLGAFTGSDVHHAEAPAWGWTAVNVKNRTVAAVLEELRNARNTVLFEPSGTRRSVALRHNPAYLALEPLDALASYSKIFYELTQGMYGFQNGTHCQPERFAFKSVTVACTILYLLLGFAGYEICRALAIAAWSSVARRRKFPRGAPAIDLG